MTKIKIIHNIFQDVPVRFRIAVLDRLHWDAKHYVTSQLFDWGQIGYRLDIWKAN